MVASGPTNPTARVEYALRADELLSEPQVRQIMEYYLAVRMRRYGRAYGDGGVGSERRRPTSGSDGTGGGERPYGASSSMGRLAAPSELRLAAGTARQHGPVRLTHLGPGARPLLSTSSRLSRARPGSPSTVRVSGTANAGVWGAGVRDSRAFRAPWPTPCARRPAHSPLRPADAPPARSAPTPRDSWHTTVSPTLWDAFLAYIGLPDRMRPNRA